MIWGNVVQNLTRGVLQKSERKNFFMVEKKSYQLTNFAVSCLLCVALYFTLRTTDEWKTDPMVQKDFQHISSLFLFFMLLYGNLFMQQEKKNTKDVVWSSYLEIKFNLIKTKTENIFDIKFMPHFISRVVYFLYEIGEGTVIGIKLSFACSIVLCAVFGIVYIPVVGIKTLLL